MFALKAWTCLSPFLSCQEHIFVWSGRRHHLFVGLADPIEQYRACTHHSHSGMEGMGHLRTNVRTLEPFWILSTVLLAIAAGIMESDAVAHSSHGSRRAL